MLACSHKVIINMCNNIIHEIIFKTTKQWVATPNISNTARIRRVVVASVAVVYPTVIVIVIVIVVVIIVDAYRYIILVVPKCITRDANIKCHGRDVVFTKSVHWRGGMSIHRYVGFALSIVSGKYYDANNNINLYQS